MAVFETLLVSESAQHFSLFFLRPYNTGFVRDHLRYVDEIVCAAARVVEAVREHARKNKNYKPSMEEGVYDAMHVR